MAATSAEFLDLIGQEIHVDLDRVRKLAFYGIPPDVRSQVWQLLLPSFTTISTGVAIEPGQQSDRRQPSMAINEERELDFLYIDGEVSNNGAKGMEGSAYNDQMYQHYSLAAIKEFELKSDAEIVRMIRSEINRCHYVQNGIDFFKFPKVRANAETILLKYFHENPSAVEFGDEPAIVHLLGPFLVVFKKPEDAYTCFQHLAQAVQHEFSTKHQKKMLAKFLMLFRSRLPQLYIHFEEEDIEHNRWAVSWLRWLLCRELSLECCLRLWDSYFSNPGDGFDLHVYVCLAILENCQSDMLDLDYPELMSFLRHIPALDMDRIIHHAQCLKVDFRHRHQ